MLGHPPLRRWPIPGSPEDHVVGEDGNGDVFYCQDIAIPEVEDDIGAALPGIGPRLSEAGNAQIQKPDRVRIVLEVEDEILLMTFPEHEYIASAPSGQRITAGAAPERVVAAAAIEHIVSVPPVQRVAGRVPNQAVVGGTAPDPDTLVALKRDVFDIGIVMQVDADRGVDLIGSAIAGLGHLVSGIVHPIEVIAASALHRIGACPSYQGIVSCAANEDVIAVAPVEKVMACATFKPVGGGIAAQGVIAAARDDILDLVDLGLGGESRMNTAVQVDRRSRRPA